MLFGSRKIKYFQKCLISPAFEIILTISFIISLSILFSFFLQIGKKINNNYKLTEIIKEEFEGEKFYGIKTKREFLNYIEFLVNRLYEFDPINNNDSFPYYIPYGSIRLRKYNNEICSQFYKSINESIICNEENCTINFYKNIQKCGNIYKNKSSKLFEKFQGKYTKYDLTNEGEFIDFNIDDYYFNDRNNNSKIDNENEKIKIKNKEIIERFIMEENLDIKFLVILFNVFFPKDKLYGNILCGIEMTNYRKEIENPYNIFSISIFDSISNKDNVFIIFYIIFTITTLFNFLKIFLEIHSKFICSIHITLLFSEIINLFLISAIILYFNALNHINLVDLDSNNYVKDKILYTNKYIDFNHILNLKGYVKIIFSIVFLTIPLKLISLFSWYTTLSKLFVQFLGLITRLIGLFLVNLIFFFGLNFTFIEMDHNFYRNEIDYFQTLYISMINQFFFDLISLVKEDEYKNREKEFSHSFSNSNYFLIFNCLEKIITIYLIVMIISSFVNSLEKASQYEIEKEEDEILLKIKDIEEKLENEEENTDNNINDLKKQILWFNLGNKNDIFINLSLESRKKMILFTSSNQVISFLKYLFAIKPEMQFKNLRNKIGIIIQEKGSSNSLMNEKIVNNIFILLDWLNFVGCKIPILIYTEEPIEKDLRMKFSHIYNFIKYTFSSSILENFIKGNEQDDEEEDFKEYDISNETKKYRYKKKELKKEKIISFTLYKVKYIIKKKNKNRSVIKSRTKKVNKRQSKFNTNCDLNRISTQIDKINKNKESETTKSQKKENEKDKDKDPRLEVVSFDNMSESNKELDL